jgi:hypothetical protein
MSSRLSQQQLRELIVESRVRLPGHAAKRHGFGRSTGLYMAAALYLAFIAVMAVQFLSPDLAVPVVAFASVLIAAFGLTVRWMKQQSVRGSASPGRATLCAQGIEL